MAGKRIPPLYCWSWRIDELRIYTASSHKGAFRVCLSLQDEGDGCHFFRARALSGHLEENKAKNRTLFSAVEAALRNKPVPVLIPMDIRGTPFQWKAWKAIAGIPFGMTKTYGQVAAMVGKAGGARAIGQAMGRNPLPLVFP
jgi:O6-methylguanine-DNA--protein-cysteine methyltransferase